MSEPTKIDIAAGLEEIKSHLHKMNVEAPPASMEGAVEIADLQDKVQEILGYLSAQTNITPPPPAELSRQFEIVGGEEQEIRGAAGEIDVTKGEGGYTIAIAQQFKERIEEDAEQGEGAGGSELPDGASTGDILYWDAGTREWSVLGRPSAQSVLTIDVTGAPVWAEVIEFVCPE